MSHCCDGTNGGWRRPRSSLPSNRRPFGPLVDAPFQRNRRIRMREYEAMRRDANLEKNVGMAERTDDVLALRKLDEIAPAKSNDNEAKDRNKKRVIRKRQPLCFPKRRKDVCVANKASFKAQLGRCEKLLLNCGESEVMIHGLGAAITKACNLALELRRKHCQTLELDVNTSTVELVDDLQPLADDDDYRTNSRQNSAVHIRLYRRVDIGTLKYAK